jgi:xeroderma pigmentosum group C-complementing protein
LEQHLNPYQTLYPKEPVGNFKGKPIYKRSCIQELHTQDKWLQQGKIIKVLYILYRVKLIFQEHEQPAKKVKRKLLKGKENSEEKNSEENKIESNLYGEWQTEPYVPPPVKDVRIT